MLCEELPVLSNQMIEEWRHAGRQALSSQVRLGNSPDIMGPGFIGSREVRVWRQTLPQTVLDFVHGAMSLEKGELNRSLMSFFAPINHFVLNDNGLQAAEEKTKDSRENKVVLSERLTEALWRPRLDEAACRGFSEYVLTSLETVLRQIPLATLGFDKVHFQYPNGLTQRTHVDLVARLLIHFTDPGTPYPVDLETRSENNPLTWRVGAGDINWHGMLVEHGVSAKRPTSDKLNPRLCLSFNTFPEGSIN